MTGMTLHLIPDFLESFRERAFDALPCTAVQVIMKVVLMARQTHVRGDEFRAMLPACLSHRRLGTCMAPIARARLAFAPLHALNKT